jgi:hypothetical protein
VHSIVMLPLLLPLLPEASAAHRGNAGGGWSHRYSGRVVGLGTCEDLTITAAARQG